jgi:hypothetical protein
MMNNNNLRAGKYYHYHAIDVRTYPRDCRLRCSVKLLKQGRSLVWGGGPPQMVVVVILSITFVGSFSQQGGRRKALHLHGFRICGWLVLRARQNREPDFRLIHVERGKWIGAPKQCLRGTLSTWIVHVEGLGRHTNRSDYVDLVACRQAPLLSHTFSITNGIAVIISYVSV